jgi:hypothetical protein
MRSEDGVAQSPPLDGTRPYHLTIQENGHSRRFVYEDRDQALTRLADAIAAGLEARLDEVVRHVAGLRYSSLASPPIEYRREEPWASERKRNPGRMNGHAVRRAPCAGPRARSPSPTLALRHESI